MLVCALSISIVALLFWRSWLVLSGVWVVVGACYMGFHIHAQQDKILPKSLEGTPLQVVGTINSVVEETELQSLRFVFEVNSPRELAAKRVSLAWYNPKVKPEPGDTWQLTIKLKRPHGQLNPAGVDLEKFWFQNRISAVGTVVTKNADYVLLSKRRTINWWRQYLLQKISVDSEFSGIVAGLLLGIRHGISDAQNLILQKTGTSHLMAISGLHLGFAAAVVMLVTRSIWYVLPIAPRNLPLPGVAAVLGLMVSGGYALLAGFSVATQRAWIMLCLLLLSNLLRRHISRVHSFCLALVLVLIWDPLVILSAGFWLSFWAVGCLLYAFLGRQQLARPWRWLYPQLVMASGLLPLTLLFFEQNAWVAPLANLIAVPWVGFAVVPFCLMGCFKIAEYNVSLIWPLLEYLQKVPIYNWSQPSTYLWLRLLCAALGFVWLFAPRGIPGRYWACCGFLPLVIAHSPAIPYQQAEFTLLDVGQGLAAVIRTTSRTLVYDTGTPGQGAMSVAPYLRKLNSRIIDALIISHADSDHAGGMADLLPQIPAQQVFSSDIDKFIGSKACIAGQQWEWDGVKFKFLHPSILISSSKRNNSSCVLLVEANDQRLLLTGDIEHPAEDELIGKYGADLQADVLVVPHHGSRTSSSESFIDHVNPVLALIPVGYRSRYGHPKPQVVARYMQREIPIYSSDRDGAITVRLGLSPEDAAFLRPYCQRSVSRQPFWRLKDF